MKYLQSQFIAIFIRIPRIFLLKLLLFLAVLFFLNGCFLTKVVTVPMRLGGAVISIVPVVGNTAHDAIDGAAAVVDEVPI